MPLIPEPHPDDAVRYGDMAYAVAVTRAVMRQIVRSLRRRMPSRSAAFMRHAVIAMAAPTTPPPPGLDEVELRLAAALREEGGVVTDDEWTASVLANIVAQVAAEEFPATDGPAPGG